MRRRIVVGLIGVLVAAGGVVAAGPRTASAHALRVASAPDDGAVLQQAPAEVTVTFGEEPDPRLSHLDVTDTTGRSFVSGAATAVPGDARQLRVSVHGISRGVYTVTWRTVSVVDGHRAAGAFAFGVGVDAARVATASSQAGAQGSSGTSWGAVLGRFVLFAGISLLLGAAAVGAVALRVEWVGVLRLAGAGLAAVVGGTLLTTVVQARDAETGWGGLLGSGIGHSLLWRLLAAGLSLAGLGAAAIGGSRYRVGLGVLGAGGAAAVLADVSASHAAATGSWTWLNDLGQWAHGAAAGVWIGGLASLLLALRSLGGEERGHAVRRFSTTAAVALGVVAVTGVARAAVELGSWGEVLGSGYGRLLVVKASLLVVLAALGLVNRTRHVPIAARSIRGLLGLGGAELAAGAAALLVAATLVNVAPPQDASASGRTGPPPAVARGADYATTLRLELTASPGGPGFNEFTARALSYEGGRPLDASDVVLHFSLALLPDLGTSSLTLHRTGPGTYAARGGNLAVDGVWTVDALVEQGSSPAAVPLVLTTTGPGPRTEVSHAPGEPTLYTVHLSAGRTVQVYVDPPGPGRATVHATFFDAGGRGLAVADARVGGSRDGGALIVYPIRQFEPGHYGADALLDRGRYRFDITGLAPGGERIITHVDITIGA